MAFKAFDLEKNAVSSTYPWLLAAEIIPINDSIVLDEYEFIVADTQIFTWDTQEFTPFPFSVDTITTLGSSQFPNIKLIAFNTATVAEKLQDTNAFLGSTIHLYFLNINAMTDTMTESSTFLYTRDNYPLKFTFIITNCTIGSSITFDLGLPNYLTINVPSRRYYRDFCPYEFGKDFCWMRDYSPAGKNCDKTWQSCRDHWNDNSQPTTGIRYGGFPMLAKGSFVYY